MTARLLACLQARANSRGLAFVQEPVLLHELHTTHDDLSSALTALERDGTVEILSRLPFLALKLKKWSGKPTKQADSAASAYSYSYSKPSLSQDVKQSYSAESRESLLQEILETLGETDASSFEGAIANFPETLIRKALDRVRRTKGIRKSKTALFRYLLTKATNDSHAQTHLP